MKENAANGRLFQREFVGSADLSAHEHSPHCSARTAKGKPREVSRLSSLHQGLSSKSRPLPCLTSSYGRPLLNRLQAICVLLALFTGVSCARAQEQTPQAVPEPTLRTALALSAAERFDEAEQQLSQLLLAAPDDTPLLYHRGRVRYCLGKFEASVADFDAYYEATPEARSRQWERGIALYFAGRYRDGAKQFEEYQTYHDADVENAAWRYLCEAKIDGAEVAARNLMQVGPDRRIPMMKIHELYGGKATPEQIFAQCAVLPKESLAQRQALFYAHLYVGLWHESRGDNEAAQGHLVKAARDYPIGHYMAWVAKVHPAVVKELQQADQEESDR